MPRHPEMRRAVGVPQDRQFSPRSITWPFAPHNVASPIGTMASAHVCANRAETSWSWNSTGCIATTGRRSSRTRTTSSRTAWIAPQRTRPGIGLELDESVAQAHQYPGTTWFALTCARRPSAGRAFRQRPPRCLERVPKWAKTRQMGAEEASRQFSLSPRCGPRRGNRRSSPGTAGPVCRTRAHHTAHRATLQQQSLLPLVGSGSRPVGDRQHGRGPASSAANGVDRPRRPSGVLDPHHCSDRGFGRS